MNGLENSPRCSPPPSDHKILYSACSCQSTPLLAHFPPVLKGQRLKGCVGLVAWVLKGAFCSPLYWISESWETVRTLRLVKWGVHAVQYETTCLSINWTIVPFTLSWDRNRQQFLKQSHQTVQSTRVIWGLWGNLSSDFHSGCEALK